MRKVLIVDDEKFIRLGVKAILEKKEDIDYETYLCSNGREALEFIEKNPIDIVITDIRMPQMDGLTFIKELKTRNSRAQIIILTGYDDFNYVLEALKCGASDYLLKPVKREELYGSLNKIEINLKSSEELINKEMLINEYIEDFRANDLNNILMNDNISEYDFNSIVNRINLKILEDKYYLVLIAKDDNHEKIKDKGIREEISIYLEGYVSEKNEEIITFFDWDKNLVLICRDKDLVDFLSKRLINDNKYRYTIALSSEADGYSDIRRVYSEAQQALKYRIFSYYAGIALIRYSDICGKKRSDVPETDKINKLCNLIGTERKNEIDKILSELMNESKASLYDISYIEEINGLINKTIYDQIIKRFFNSEDNIIKRYERLNNIYNFASFKEYLEELRDYIANVNEYIKTIKEIYGDSSKMEKAIDYINKNYNKDLNLAMVSNEISLNYSYFSQAFKDYTGENFVNYLRKLRIDKAKELLVNGEYKIYEVAKRVGYPDSKQFTKIFRSITGISPIEYKSMNEK